MTTSKKILPTKKTKNKLILLIVFLILLSSFVIFLFFRKNQTNSISIKYDQLFEEISQEIVNLDKKRIFVRKQEPSINHFSWTEENLTLGIESDYGLGVSVIEDNANEIDKIIHQKIAKSIENILINNGFKADKNNTQTNSSDEFPILNFSYGYKSDEIRCLIVSESTVYAENQNNISTLYFSCFKNDKFQKTYNQQYPYIIALDEAGVYEPITDITTEGNSALVYLTSSKVNAYLHKNKEGKWVFIMKNQDFACKELEEKGVPKKDLINCIDEDGNQL